MSASAADGPSAVVGHRLRHGNNETVEWFAGIRERLPAAGFCLFDRVLLPARAWWTDYYAPLEARTRYLRSRQHGSVDEGRLTQHEREIAMVKAASERFACGFFISRATA